MQTIIYHQRLSKLLNTRK